MCLIYKSGPQLVHSSITHTEPASQARHNGGLRCGGEDSGQSIQWRENNRLRLSQISSLQAMKPGTKISTPKYINF